SPLTNPWSPLAKLRNLYIVIPAKAGIHFDLALITPYPSSPKPLRNHTSPPTQPLGCEHPTA
ncbi:hypothetical protein, partial [Pseudomonas sp. CGJS7]|uniref:hypothetical protein n=1 Tax=Pseudomonas sp. CGJS7 TaxID=3109348 RepID=UPI003008C462